MDATTYSQILLYLASSDKRYPQSIYDIYECLNVCIVYIYIYIYLNDIENKKHKKNICYSISVLSPTINNICRKCVEICIKIK